MAVNSFIRSNGGGNRSTTCGRRHRRGYDVYKRSVAIIQSIGAKWNRVGRREVKCVVLNNMFLHTICVRGGGKPSNMRAQQHTHMPRAYAKTCVPVAVHCRSKIHTPRP
jgi:hypothetical protein